MSVERILKHTNNDRTDHDATFQSIVASSVGQTQLGRFIGQLVYLLLDLNI